MSFFVMRHGESVWNKENKFTGWTDVGLSEKGEQEAIIAGEKLKKINLKKLANNWIIEQEIHFIFIKNKYKFREVAIRTTYDKDHRSLLPPIKYVSSVILFTLYYSFLKN